MDDLGKRKKKTERKRLVEAIRRSTADATCCLEAYIGYVPVTIQSLQSTRIPTTCPIT